MTITRFVTCTERAKQLPGATGDLLTETLRKLIANPDVLIEGFEDDRQGHQTCAGTKELLVSKGIAPADMFECKFDDIRYGNYERGRDGVTWVYRLRNGFYMVERESGDLQQTVLNLRGRDMDARPKHVAEALRASVAKRTRCVGRFRRQVNWQAVGSVLFIDWKQLMIDRMTCV